MGANLILPAGSAAASGGGDSTPAEGPVTRSLRFDDGSSPYLVRAASDIGTPTNAKKVTVAFWFKLGNIVANRRVLVSASNSAGTDFWWLELDASHRLNFMVNNNSSSVQGQYITNRVFRDPSAWYHICVSCDSTASQAADRAIIYINGVRETSFSTTNHLPADWLNEFNEGTYSQYISSFVGSMWHFDGYIADVYNIDGQQLDHTSFTESNNYGGGLKPKAYTGSFGNNGFHLDSQPTNDSDLLVTSIDRNDGDTTFADAAQGHGLTVSGNTEHSIAVGNPFTSTGRAIDFGTSTSNYLKIWDGSTGDYNLGSDDFTMEAWYNTNDTKSYMTLFSHYQDANNWFCLYVYTNDYLYWYWETGGTYIQINNSSGGVQWQHHKWNHVAVTKSGTTHKLWLNGVQVATGTKGGSHTFTSTRPMYLGTLQGYGSSYHGDGYVYDARISSSVRYTSDFDVPTEKFTDDSDTELLLQPDNSDSDWDDVDKSHNSHGVTENGTVTRTASTPYEAAAKSSAIHFDGSGDYLQTPSDSIFAIATSETFTAECWVYFNSNPSSSDFMGILSAYNLNSALSWIIENAGGYWSVYDSSGTRQTTSTAVTTGVWHHVALVKNSSTAGGSSLYLNGNRLQTCTVSSNATAARKLTIGGIYASTNYNLNGYIFDARYAKGETKYSGSTYDTPSAPFELNPVYLGGDQSGNKSHFTPTNISSHDVMLDVPYPKNYATMNPVSDVVVSGSNTFSEGNLKLYPSYAYNKGASTIAVSSGKWYAEVRYDSAGYQMAGIGRVDCLENTTHYIGQSSSAFGYVIYRNGGDMYHNGSSTSIFSSISSGDILQIALDLDNNKVWWGLNGTWVGTVGSSGGTSISAGEYYFVQTYRDPCTWNFGQDNTFAGQFTGTPDNAEFAYEIPENFKSLNSSNLDDPTVTPEENFNIALYSGTSSSNSITGLGFQPDILWTKSRSTSGSSPKIFDSIRGVTKRLQPDQTAVEQAVTELTSFDSDGFTLGSDSGSNYSGRTYVGWCWKAHQSPTSNTTTYTVKVEDNSGDAWDYSGNYYDYSTYLPSVYMEIFENRNSSLVSLGKVAVRSYDSSGTENSDLSEQTYTLECADLNAIAVKWYYDTSGDNDEYDYPNYYNDYLNDQKITILDGTTSEWTTNNYSNDDGTSSNYSPPTGWANGDTLKSATTSYNGSDTATLTSGSSSGPTEKYNAAAGFTIISYSGDGYTDGDSQTLDHSLGVPLDFVIAKPRTNNHSMGGNWVVWHKDLGNYEYLILNSSSAKKTDYNSNEVIDTATSGSQHQVVVNNGYDGSNYHYLNMGPYSGTAGEDYILYGWAGVEGYSRFGKYTGNGCLLYTSPSPRDS